MTEQEHWRRADTARGQAMHLTVDGKLIEAFEGETVVAAMLAAGTPFDRDHSGAPRAPLCNMGTCFECTAVVEGRAATRTCLVPVREGLTVETTRRL